MLAVAVDLDHVVVAVLQRVDEARLHGAADAEVERRRRTRAPARSAHCAVCVGRAVVDDEDVELGRLARAARRMTSATVAASL